MTESDDRQTAGGRFAENREDTISGGQRPAGEEDAPQKAAKEEKPAERLAPEISRQITGAVKRQVGKALEEALRRLELDGIRTSNEAPNAGHPGSAVPVQLRKRIEDLEEEVGTWQRRAYRAQIIEALDRHEVTPGARDLLADRLAAEASADEGGALFIDSLDGEIPLEDHLCAFLAGRRDLVRSRVRGGSGAAARRSTSVQTEPRDLTELLRDPATGRATPERAEQYRKSHPEKYAELRERARTRGSFSGSAVVKTRQSTGAGR